MSEVADVNHKADRPPSYDLKLTLSPSDSGLHQELMRLTRDRAHLFRHLRADGAVCAGERGGCGAHETPGGQPQTGEHGFVVFVSDVCGMILGDDDKVS